MKVVTIVYCEKLWKNLKNKKNSLRTKFRVQESVTRGEGISAPTTPILRWYFNQISKMSVIF